MVKSVDKKKLSLRPVNKQDFSTIEVWLNKDYIKKWYGEPSEWMLEIRNDSGNFDWLNHYIVLYQDMPIGFCQYYDCSKTSAGFEWDSEPQGTFCIDYLIGQDAFLKKGLGSVIVQQLCRLVCTLEDPVQIIADPVPENIDSIKLLEKNGFTLDPITGLYKIKTEKLKR
ncbi:GNAT family N-acetyltransferase [Fusibacter ferrireducens]|uniref:GNAT family N-acetyltransferase n=1 Tax=Fusibacter ferrireducens TaxID=2785058 RepID=A0ABR9ZY08_9FIRM|nr:GNAT family N-acetyltransferase [Fusibacter ferrireducens]MBF4695256.1 GNAT family N-acetyltransferase [Fusibacter ferrireducens]